MNNERTKSMELIYIWVDKFRNYEKEEIYFSNQFEVNYNQKDQTLKVLRSQSYVSLQKKGTPLISINGIVGKNGVGKTNLLDLIGSRYADRGLVREEEKYFFLYYIEEKDIFIIEGNHIDLLETLIERERISKEYFCGKKWCAVEVKLEEGGRLRYIGNNFDNKKDKYILSLRDKWNSNHFDQRSRAEDDEPRIMIQRRQSEDRAQSYIPVVEMLVEQLARPRRELFQDESYELRITYNDFAVELYEIIYGLVPLDNYFYENLLGEEISYNKVLKAIVLNYLRRAIRLNRIEEKEEKDFYVDMLKEAQNINQWQLYYWRLISYINEEILKLDDEITEKYNQIQYEELLKALGCTNVFRYNDGEKESYNQDSYLSLEIQKDLELEQYEKAIKATIDSGRLSEQAQAANLFHDFFKHSIRRLSGGEETYLDILAALNEQLTDILSDTKHYIILLDEPDRNMHPELARNFIYNLDSFVRDRFQGTEKTIQIIIATHSPFILTDIQKEKVIFIEREGRYTKTVKKPILTFGGHIQKLLIDDFFMDSTIGEYATQKIKEVIAWTDDTKLGIQEYKDNHAYYEAIIQSVGDPIIKLKLEKKFQEHKDLVWGRKNRNYKFLEELLQKQTEELNLLRKLLAKDNE